MSIYILNKNHGKSAEDLINEATLSLDRIKQRRHELWILSCYVDLDLVEKYADYLLKSIRLTNVYLAFNFAEIYKAGPVETKIKLHSIKKRLNDRNIEFEWNALASSKLVHSKGYALIQRLDDAISGGVVLVTSANFTVPGFRGENIEIGYLSNKMRDIKDFEEAYDYLWNALGVDVTHAVFKQEVYLLKFALLSSGVFLHKWSGSLSQDLGIKYKLTELAKEKGTIAPELAAVGFEAGDTFTRQVLDLGDLPQKEVPRSFITRFTIETYWGRWCPSDAWNVLRKSFEDSRKFIAQFRDATEESVLSKVKDEALEIQSELIGKSLIKPVRSDHLDNWVNRIQELRTNDRRLERFFIGYEAHELPYSFEQKPGVTDLFDSVEEAIGLTKSTNIAKEKIALAINHANPDLIHLTDEERKIIIDMSNNT
ncbi:MAG: hypothetical protein A2286_08145 [Gammaproteobacteria bacterium RIFOXYA12_FULL_61_12]|nr:MAG: hypothetical protein A2514_01770 [Gammaproteobacteria bacterium RIFOXYD12_FULL_61_37]OGT90002.1 MAG: hypothetical protein A2286_08145 [Gammaproteobacteria bacterium RIFOXYA12_FULL_61_12]